MTVEEQLREAMERHVAGVQASPGLGRAVRRGRRTRQTWVRTAGAVLVTAAVAGAIPAYQAFTPETGPAGKVATAQVVTEVAVPLVRGLPYGEAVAAVKAAGLASGEPSDLEGVVVRQSPAPGTMVAPGTWVELLTEAPVPQDLGDLGDGRTVGAVRVGYLPEGLVWSRWSGKDGFGQGSYTTSYDEPGAESGRYSIQLVVREGKSAEQADGLLGRLVEEVRIKDGSGRMGNLGEGGEGSKIGEDGDTPTIAFKLDDRILIEVMMSPTLAEKLGREKIVEELKKIAEGIEIAKAGQ